MEPSDTSAPTVYSYTYRHGVDQKRRVQIPAKWRPTSPGMEFTLVVWFKSKEGPCLRVLPPEQMAVVKRDIDAMPNTDPNKLVLKRLIGSRSIQVPLDTVGRVCIPDEMARDAGITDQAVLVGLLDSFEIWSPERYKAVEVADAVMAAEAFKLIP